MALVDSVAGVRLRYEPPVSRVTETLRAYAGEASIRTAMSAAAFFWQGATGLF
jgi:hypothetical protein